MLGALLCFWHVLPSSEGSERISGWSWSPHEKEGMVPAGGTCVAQNLGVGGQYHVGITGNGSPTAGGPLGEVEVVSRGFFGSSRRRAPGALEQAQLDSVSVVLSFSSSFLWLPRTIPLRLQPLTTNLLKDFLAAMQPALWQTG